MNQSCSMKIKKNEIFINIFFIFFKKEKEITCIVCYFLISYACCDQ